MIVLEKENLYEMTKLLSDYADEELCGDIGDYIYFSPSLDAHGPRVKFYGGTKETSSTRNAPSLAFTNDGVTELKLASWMNKKNCPNAFSDEYVNKVSNFINRVLPILLLVWYNKLDEGRALKYFEGAISMRKLLSYCEDIDLEIKNKMMNAVTLNNLHRICKENNLYSF